MQFTERKVENDKQKDVEDKTKKKTLGWKDSNIRSVLGWCSSWRYASQHTFDPFYPSKVLLLADNDAIVIRI